MKCAGGSASLFLILYQVGVSRYHSFFVWLSLSGKLAAIYSAESALLHA